MSFFSYSDENDENDELDESEPQKEVATSSTKKTVQIAGRDGNYQIATTILDRYPMRPNRLEEMTLAQFSTCYVVAYTVAQSTQFDKDGCSNDLSNQNVFNTQVLLPQHITLKENLGLMRLRRFPQVMRFHSSKRKEGHEEHYSELLLFCHWRNEVVDFKRSNPKACIEVYEERRQELIDNKSNLFPGEQVLEAIDTADLEELKPTHIYDLIASQNVQDNEDDREQGVLDDPDFESFGYTGNLGEENRETREDCKFRKIKLPSNDELEIITRQLVPEQMNALRHIVFTMKSILRAKENLNISFKPLQLIVHGGAGVGKSSFIRAASMQAEKILCRPGDDPNYPKVLLCAPTGKAASLIGE